MWHRDDRLVYTQCSKTICRRVRVRSVIGRVRKEMGGKNDMSEHVGKDRLHRRLSGDDT